MENSSILQKGNKLSVVGLLFIVPALILVTHGIIFTVSGISLFEHKAFPFNILTHPVLILGGLLFALGLNLLPTFRINFQKQDESWEITLTIYNKLLSLIIVALGTLLLGTILLYGFVENWIR